MTAYSGDPKAEDLLRLSTEVSRIAGALVRLSADQSGAEPKAAAIPGPDIRPERVAGELRGRRLRARFFDEQLFADPAWDMLLELFHAELTHRRVAISTLCAASNVPPTTALRWLNTLVKQDLVVRQADPLDGRRVFCELAPKASTALRNYFAELAGVGII